MVRRLTQKACRTKGEPHPPPEASAASPATQDAYGLWEQRHDGFVEAVASLPALQAGQRPCQLVAKPFACYARDPLATQPHNQLGCARQKSGAVLVHGAHGQWSSDGQQFTWKAPKRAKHMLP